MARCLAKPCLVWRVEAHREERPGDAEQPVVLAEHRGRGLRAEFHDPQTLALSASPELHPAGCARVAHPVPNAVRSDEPALVAVPNDGHGRRPWLSGHPASNRQHVRVWAGQPEPRQGPHESVERAAPETPSVRPRLAFHACDAIHARTPRPPLTGRSRSPPGRLDDPDQCAKGLVCVAFRVRASPSRSTSPTPNPIPTAGHSKSRPELVTETGSGTFE